MVGLLWWAIGTVLMGIAFHTDDLGVFLLGCFFYMLFAVHVTQALEGMHETH